MSKTDYIKLIASIAICQLARIIGSIFTLSSINSWYAGLNQPIFNPPNWVFGPVWTILYLMIGISLYLLWNTGLKNKTWKKAKNLFLVQLGLNTLWPILFFGLKSPLLAFIEIIFLWAAILLTFMHFHRISKKAAYLLVPYILWVSFAVILNLSYVILN